MGIIMHCNALQYQSKKYKKVIDKKMLKTKEYHKKQLKIHRKILKTVKFYIVQILEEKGERSQN